MTLKEKLRKELAATNWQGLAAHFSRGNVFLLVDELDLLETAIAIAHDDSSTISSHLKMAKLAKPTKQQAEEWEKIETSFEFLIIQPFVLIKEKKSDSPIKPKST
tara:strand:- start:735 stop:1049 length:315 start_codon:yes stop_codon:yes gene_type:complete